MSDQKPSMLSDLGDVREAVNGLGRAVNKFFQNGSDRVIGPAATQALDATKSGLAAGFRKAKARVFGEETPEEVEQAEPIAPIPSGNILNQQDVVRAATEDV